MLDAIENLWFSSSNLIESRDSISKFINFYNFLEILGSDMPLLKMSMLLQYLMLEFDSEGSSIFSVIVLFPKE